jgi:hypothetical protein
MRKKTLSFATATILLLFTSSGGAQQTNPDALEQAEWGTFQLDLQRAMQSTDVEKKRDAAIEALAIEPKLRNWTAPLPRPEVRAELQLLVATANVDRTKGDHSRDLETAIVYAQSSLQFFTRQEFPQLWAAAKEVLGSAYAQRIEGDKAANIETSIGAVNEALSVFTQEAFPAEWASSQTLLAM